MNDLVDRFGGADKVLGCGSVMTEGFQVPMVAWVLGVPTTRIEAPPTLGGAAHPQPASDAPNVILQTRDTRSAHLLPFLSTWPTVTLPLRRHRGPGPHVHPGLLRGIGVIPGPNPLMATVTAPTPGAQTPGSGPATPSRGCPTAWRALPRWLWLGGGLTLLMALSAFLRTRYIGGEFWMDEGITTGHLAASASARSPGSCATTATRRCTT